MFELVGLAIGAFLGYLVADFLVALDPLREKIRQGVGQVIGIAREKLSQIMGNNSSPLVPIGILLIVVILAFWLLGFSSAMLLGLVLGVVYKEEIGRLPLVSGVADTVKQTISKKMSGPK